ncbi:hypothetical protein SAMN04488090_3714 [Siphonobacter aquaeclarae]|uniref:Uncharacterized protein n=1 Tax=Siphonobacter aquaeclarae TaxID=563176 RepID=A0A1G9U8Q2_9BACT|nr:hypothetical protein SAMN04488090_3714 [Siphonobacter aquaeclarae]
MDSILFYVKSKSLQTIFAYLPKERNVAFFRPAEAAAAPRHRENAAESGLA